MPIGAPSGTTTFLGRRLVEVTGLILVLVGFACGAALASYDPMDPSSVTGVRGNGFQADGLARRYGRGPPLPGHGRSSPG